ncbi:MAG: hypothetical protein HC828_06335 [Blastochloris sp.]|nr:hypothetical protein [Blastochloris sp.]
MHDWQPPLVLLDVDGVLIPYAAPERPLHAVSVPSEDEDAWLLPQHGVWLRTLVSTATLIWATGWEDDANRIIAPTPQDSSKCCIV